MPIIMPRKRSLLLTLLLIILLVGSASSSSSSSSDATAASASSSTSSSASTTSTTTTTSTSPPTTTTTEEEETICEANSNNDNDSLSTTTNNNNTNNNNFVPKKNSAFIFIKPHANTELTQNFVKTTLLESGITILREITIDGVTIDKNKLIDQHYYSIASKATILQPKDIPVPISKFEEYFNESYYQVLNEGRLCNAIQAMEKLQLLDSNNDDNNNNNIGVEELNLKWQQIPDRDMIKFGGGFYCGKVYLRSYDNFVFVHVSCTCLTLVYYCCHFVFLLFYGLLPLLRREDAIAKC